MVEFPKRGVAKMAVSKAQQLAKAKYQHEKRALVASEVSKEKRDAYSAAAKSLGLSVSMLIQNGVEEFIKNHAGEKFPTEVKPESISAADRRLLESFGKCPEHVKPTLKKLIEQIAKGGNENGDN